jgi:hypothetical protein
MQKTDTEAPARVIITNTCHSAIEYEASGHCSPQSASRWWEGKEGEMSILEGKKHLSLFFCTRIARIQYSSSSAGTIAKIWTRVVCIWELRKRTTRNPSTRKCDLNCRRYVRGVSCIWEAIYICINASLNTKRLKDSTA